MKKPKTKVAWWQWIVGTLFVLLVGFGLGFGADRLWMRQNSLPPKENARLATVYQTIKKNYYEQTNDTKLVDGAIDGMLGSLKDPYSEFLIDNAKNDLDAQISASFGGIGATIQQNDKSLSVASVLPGTPAKKAGIQVGDVLTAVNHKSTKGLSVTQAVAKIRGKIGTKVTLTLQRAGKSLDLELTRAKITTETVLGELNATDKTVGVITISTFSDPTAEQFRAQVETLRKKGATRFVIDLRGNPGGSLEAVTTIASMLLKNGQKIVSIATRHDGTDVYKAGKDFDGGFKVTEPVAVLVDKSSASASEILAAALKEARKASVVGTKTYGKGVVQNVAPLDATREMKLTIAKWLTPDGNWINGKGVTPTIQVDYPAYYDLQNIASLNLSQGASGEDVQRIKHALNALGDTVGTTPVFTPELTQALQRFQVGAGLPANGVADQATLIALMSKVNAYFLTHDPMMQKAIESFKG